jgi:hypothetical protein
LLELIVLGGVVAFLSKVLSSPDKSIAQQISPAAEDTESHYDFDYRLVDGEWRAYIRRQPDYRGRYTDLHSTHRHRDDNGYYVCWSEPLRSLEDCRAVACQWTEKTEKYIRTGERF